MPLVTKSRIIVLHTTRQGDNALVLNVLDETAGRQGLFVRGVGKTKSSAVFHPLSILDVVKAESPYSSIPTLKEFSPEVSLANLRSDIRRSSIALFICEILYRTMRSGDGDETLFNFVAQSAISLDSEAKPTANFHLWWLVNFCSLMGFKPEDNWSDGEATLFDMAAAHFVPQYGLQNEAALFPKEESALLHRLISSDLEAALTLPLNAAQRVNFSKFMLEYLSHHLGQRVDIRSMEVLHSVFG